MYVFILLGMRAVANFIEVATSTTGEGDYYLEKLAMLHEVATGYSSLIFDVKPSMGFNDLCKKCRSLWKALEENSELPQYLVNILLQIYVAMCICVHTHMHTVQLNLNLTEHMCSMGST